MQGISIKTAEVYICRELALKQQRYISAGNCIKKAEVYICRELA
jgi:hypothetical protein